MNVIIGHLDQRKARVTVEIGPGTHQGWAFEVDVQLDMEKRLPVDVYTDVLNALAGFFEDEWTARLNWSWS
jgi:hypothetical protein